MRIDFSAVPADLVEDWKHNPVTGHLMAQLSAVHAHWIGRCEKSAASGEKSTVTAGLGGRALMLREIATDIKDAKGAKTK